MNEISGQEVIKHCRSVNKTICIVVLSSNIQKTEKEKCFTNGADYFIEKHLTLEKLNKFKDYYDAKYHK